MVTRSKNRVNNAPGTFVIEKSDVFIGIIAVLVVTLVAYAGSQPGPTSKAINTTPSLSVSESEPKPEATTRKLSAGRPTPPPAPTPTTTTAAAAGTGAASGGFAKDDQAKIDSIHGAKFSIGETQKGTHHGRGQHWLGGMRAAEHMRAEFSAADQLVDEAKLVKKEIQEKQIG